MTETVENLETIENRSEAINEVSVTETQPAPTNSENAATAETSNAPVTEGASVTENAATAETSSDVTPAPPAPAETTENTATAETSSDVTPAPAAPATPAPAETSTTEEGPHSVNPEDKL